MPYLSADVSEQDTESVVYQPGDKEQNVVKFVYDEYDDMWKNVMNKSFPEMNDRTPEKFWDDSQKRLNAYVPTRASQGKEEWQANIFTATTRNKIRSYVSSVSKEPPEISILATNKENEQSMMRAEIMRHLLRHSYLANSNPEMTIFYDGWNCAGNGTLVKYDGWLYQTQKTEIVKSFDPLTGKTEAETQEIVIEDCPIEVEIPLNRFFVKNAYIRDVQEQPAVLWVDYMDLDEFLLEFGKYKNAKHVRSRAQIQESRGQTDLFFGEKWFDRMERRQAKIEVFKYYSKVKNKYCIVANGVLILDVPLLWGRTKKWYPFSKTIFEPFANSTLFWGNSLANILMPQQDAENNLYNSMLDKTYRTLVTPMLVSMANKDAMELEDEFVTGDTRIYVDDINGVKPMPIEGVSASEFNMLKMVSQELSLASVDALQQGFSGSGVTAREIVIANEKANEIKGVFFTMLKDLWLQKMKIRVINLLTHLSQGQRLGMVLGEEKASDYIRLFNIPHTKLTSGETGLLQIRVAEPETIKNLNRVVGYTEPGKPFNRLDVEEEKVRVQEGQPVEIMAIPPDYLDDWEFDLEIQTQSMQQRGKSLEMALAMEKVTTIAQLFPEIFATNKDKFFSELMRQFNDDPQKYLEQAAQGPLGLPQAGLEAQGGPVAGQLASVAQSLPQLTGVGL